MDTIAAENIQPGMTIKSVGRWYTIITISRVDSHMFHAKVTDSKGALRRLLVFDGSYELRTDRQPRTPGSGNPSGGGPRSALHRIESSR